MLSSLVVTLLAAGVRNLEMTTNYRVFFSSDNPQLQAFENLERVVGQTCVLV